MRAGEGSSNHAHVAIVGGGVAALEAAVALRALAGDLVRLTLISPTDRFAYRATSTVEAFGEPLVSYKLPDLAAGLGATFHRARLESIAPGAKTLRTSSGLRLDYDALVLAIGARPHATLAGAVVFRDRRDATKLRQLRRQAAEGAIGRVVFAVPSPRMWSLPVYELALLLAGFAFTHELELQVALVTPERSPLEVFGRQVSRTVEALLAESKVEFIGGSLPRGVRRDGALELAFDAPVAADAVVTAPELRGQRIAGLPANWWGFVPVERSGRVIGLQDVYAAGDMTTFPVKQGGLAAQQADRIAHTIASGLGAQVKAPRDELILQAKLMGGEHPVILRVELDEFGKPAVHGDGYPAAASTQSSSKVFARYLTAYLERSAPARNAA